MLYICAHVLMPYFAEVITPERRGSSCSARWQDEVKIWRGLVRSKAGELSD